MRLKTSTQFLINVRAIVFARSSSTALARTYQEQTSIVAETFRFLLSPLGVIYSDIKRYLLKPPRRVDYLKSRLFPQVLFLGHGKPKETGSKLSALPCHSFPIVSPE